MGVIDRYLLEKADEEEQKLKAEGKRILCIWESKHSCASDAIAPESDAKKPLHRFTDCAGRSVASGTIIAPACKRGFERESERFLAGKGEQAMLASVENTI